MKKMLSTRSLLVLSAALSVLNCRVEPGIGIEDTPSQTPSMAGTVQSAIEPKQLQRLIKSQSPYFFKRALLTEQPQVPSDEIYSQSLSKGGPQVDKRVTTSRTVGTSTGEANLDTGAAFLDCFKQAVIDCGGAHNRGNCTNFLYWNASPTSAARFLGCIYIKGEGCALTNPFGVIACAIF